MSFLRRGEVGKAAAVVAVAVLAFAAGARASAGGQGERAGPAVRVEALDQRPGAVRDYWTARRMRAARPADLHMAADGRVVRALAGSTPRAGPPSRRAAAAEVSGAGSSYPARVNGKAFVHFDGGSDPGDFVCSATAVRSNTHTVVWTAGHCVDDAEFGGGFASSWMFIPGYRDGQRPFGDWFAHRLVTSAGWRDGANLRLDIGAAIVTRDEQGRGIEDVIGARRIAFDQPRDQTYEAFGYPAQPNPLSLPPRVDFDGERLYSCSSGLVATDPLPPGNGPNPNEIECDMTGGSSGGGWVGAAGALAGVTSYGYGDDGNHLFGPYFGALAETVYRAASGAPLRCGGRAVTNLGKGGAQRYRGTPASDVFKLGGGADGSSGGQGEDVACGGAGRDRLRGDGGADALRGGPSRDLLAGGPGRDLCVGGPGRDRAIGCERRRAIP